MAKMGRPSIYDPAVIETLLDRVSDGEVLHKICEDEDMPYRRSVRRWIDEDYEGLANRYKIARELGLEVLAEQILSIADDGSNDYLIDNEGNKVINHEHIARSKVRIDSRKWLLSRLCPKQYGDRVQQEITGANGTPLPVVVYLPSNGREVEEESE